MARTILILSLCLLFSATGVEAGWFSYDNYEDCMLGKMKGQNSRMYFAADKACKREFKVEFDILPSSVKWHFTHDMGEVEITIDSSDEYEITSGVFTFAEKGCAEAKDEDFSGPRNVQFRVGKAVYTDFGHEMLCGRVKEFRGRYR